MKCNCIACGKPNLDKNTIAINKKLISQNVINVYCIECLAEVLEVSTQDILDKIEEFKEEGCTLFD